MKGYFPPVVNDGEFHAARLAMRSRANAPGRRGKEVTNLFLGLAKCADCGPTMTLENKGASSKGGRYFVCSDAARNAGCGNRRRWRLDTVEAKVLGALRHADLSAFADTGVARLDSALAASEAELADVRARRERLLALVEDGDASAVKRYKELGARIADLEREVAAARTAATAAGAVPSWQERSRILADLIRRMANADGEERRIIRTEVAQLLRTTLARVAFGKHRIVGRYHDARLAYRPHRVVPRLGETVRAYEITLFDEVPVVLDEEDIVMLESSVDVPNVPLPAHWGKRPRPDTDNSRKDCIDAPEASTASCALASMSVRTR